MTPLSGYRRASGVYNPSVCQVEEAVAALHEPGYIRWAVNSLEGTSVPPGMQAYVDVTLIMLGALIAVAWSTLLERKLLGGYQWRKGPNKMRAKGGLQPLGDAAKLLLKGSAGPLGRGVVFILAPIFSLVITLLIWSLWQSPSG